MRLVGIEIKNFRSIGSEPVTLHPFSKCNLIVGQNNIGKSGVLYGVRKLISIARGDKHSALTELDLHNRDKSRPVRFTLFFEMDGGGSENESAIRSVSGGSSLVFEFEKAIRGELTVTNHTLAHVASLQAANVVMSKLFNETFGSGASKSGIERELIKRGIPIFNSLCRSYLPELSIIPEFRQLQTAKGENPLDGSGLIETLATWQHPDIGSDDLPPKLMPVGMRVPQVALNG